MLIFLFFGNDHGENLINLKFHFCSVHDRMSRAHNRSTKPEDFEESLTTLEGAFLPAYGRTVQFINPSIRDLLNDELADESLVQSLMGCEIGFEWNSRLWRYLARLVDGDGEKLTKYAAQFSKLDFVSDYLKSTRIEVSGNERIYGDRHSLLAQGVYMFLVWWRHCKEEKCITDALRLLERPLECRGDVEQGVALAELHRWICDNISHDKVMTDRLRVGIEGRIIEVMWNTQLLKDMVTLTRAMTRYLGKLWSTEIQDVIESRMDWEIQNWKSNAGNFSSAVQLWEYVECFDILSVIVGRNTLSEREQLEEMLRPIQSEVDRELSIGFREAMKPVRKEWLDDDGAFDFREVEKLFRLLEGMF